MRAFVINLDRSKDRLAVMQAQLSFERIPAVDGLALPASMRREFLDDSGAIASRLIAGEVGCYASHMLAWERVIAEALPYALVLEDDVTLAFDAVTIAAKAAQSAPKGWDLIHLYDTNKKAVIPLAQLGNNCHLVRYMRRPINACGYVISQSGARKMRKPSARVRPVDVEMRHGYLRAMDIYGVSPSIVANGPVNDAVSMIGHAEERIGSRQWSPDFMELGKHLFQYQR